MARHDALAFACASRLRRCDRSRKADGPYSQCSTCRKVTSRAFTGGPLRGPRTEGDEGQRVSRPRNPMVSRIRRADSVSLENSRRLNMAVARAHAHAHTYRDVTLYTQIRIHSPF